MDLKERVARAIGEAALNDDPGRTQLDWPDISYPDANGGLNLLVLAQAAIDEIVKGAESCGVCGCAVYKGLPTAVGQSPLK
jgi:hypothetical protein